MATSFTEVVDLVLQLVPIFLIFVLIGKVDDISM